MKVIGLTGKIGCGKSTVAAMLRRRGVATIDLDRIAREIRQNDGETRGEIVARFGTIDARRLGAIVFADAGALRDLEAILHPRVRDAARARLAELTEHGVGVAAVEAIKLLESPLHDACDQVWVVRCDEAEAVRRTASSRKMTEAEARARLASQSPQDEMTRAADVVIDGSSSMEETRRQVGAALDALLAARS
ncbi:MAG: dephospho-CoA kinase [Chloroflexota bacterium]|nr:dephospho-CoA kinase [Chloroflexota bacterium]